MSTRPAASTIATWTTRGTTARRIWRRWRRSAATWIGSPATPGSSTPGCGEGVLVQEYAGRLRIEGVDANYRSDRVREGSVDRASLRRRARSTRCCASTCWNTSRSASSRRRSAELFRVLKPGGVRAHLGSEPRPPAVPRPLPAAGAPDQDGEPREAPGGSPRRGVSPARAGVRLRGGGAPRDLPHRAGACRARAAPPWFRCSGCTRRSRALLPVPGLGLPEPDLAAQARARPDARKAVRRSRRPGDLRGDPRRGGDEQPAGDAQRHPRSPRPRRAAGREDGGGRRGRQLHPADELPRVLDVTRVDRAHGAPTEEERARNQPRPEPEDEPVDLPPDGKAPRPGAAQAR
ncbi:MAG: hypothetical protein MZU84_03985 [Sphingobacterium sp.]|nr:hypothetical protein [Sphingobacterium sp.]